MDYLTRVKVQDLKIGQSVYLPVKVNGHADQIITTIKKISSDENGIFSVQFSELTRNVHFNAEDYLIISIYE